MNGFSLDADVILSSIVEGVALDESVIECPSKQLLYGVARHRVTETVWRCRLLRKSCSPDSTQASCTDRGAVVT